jgi:hypothetical protein
MHTRSGPLSASLASLAIALVVAACSGSPGSATASPSPTPTVAATAGLTASVEPSPTATQGAVATTPPATAGSAPDPARIATGETPAGWVEVVSPAGTCRIAVPSDWDTQLIPGTGAKLLEAQASAFDTDFATWDEFKANMKFLYFGADKVIDVDSADVLIMHTGPSSADYSYFVALNEGDHACGTLSTVVSSSIATHRETSHQILYTLATKP